MACHVITIAQQKGGAGKTTVAAHLAVALMQRRNRVAVIDIDPQGSLTHWYGLREKHFGEDYTGLSFSTLSGWRVGSEVSRLKRDHDYIIIDSPPHTETEARTAIRMADLVIVPVQPAPTDVWATKATLDLAKAEKIPVMVLPNRLQANSKLAQTMLKELPSLTRSAFGNRVLFPASLLEGRTATETVPGSTAAFEVKDFVKEVSEFFKPKHEDDLEVAARAKSKSKELA